MNDDQLRAIVRETVARHLARVLPPADAQPAWKAHPSHGLLPMVAGRGDGPCIIEPAVECHHCAYCQSMGH